VNQPKAALLLQASQKRSFDAILARIKAAGLSYRSSPVGSDDYKVNHDLWWSPRYYWSEPDGHAWEIVTASYARSSCRLVNAARSRGTLPRFADTLMT
jgi:hypothetical protein